MGDDDRNDWLDLRAAERLLDGEPLDAGPALPPADRDAAERLAALLDTAARAGRPVPGTELPGEQAALAAFRAARAAESAGAGGAARNGPPVNGRSPNDHARNGTRPRGESRVPPRQGAAEPVVRLAPGPSATAPVRPAPRRLRRLRTAAAVTAAGCVLGGVALAAGTALRGAPAAPETTPGPATSPTATAGPDRTGGDDADEGAASAGGSRTEDRPEGRRDARGTAGGTGAEPGGGADGAGEPDGRPGDGAAPGGSGHGDGPGAKATSVERLCKKFHAVHDGESKAGDKKSWNRLVRSAGGEDALADYCEKRGGAGAGNRHPGGHGPGGGDRAGRDQGEDDERDEDD